MRIEPVKPTLNGSASRGSRCWMNEESSKTCAPLPPDGECLTRFSTGAFAGSESTAGSWTACWNRGLVRRREGRTDLGTEGAEQQGEKDRRAGGAAYLPEEVGRGGCDTHVSGSDRILHGNVRIWKQPPSPAPNSAI